KTAHAVVDLQPLYLLGGTERLVPILRFKKTVKIGLGKIKKLAFVEGGEGMEYEVTLKDGKSHTLTLLDRSSPVDGKAGQRLGLVGKAPVGYKVFPVKPAPNNVFTAIVFEPEKGEEKKEDKKADSKKEKE